MNKKIIVFGSFLAVFLMLITPNVNAIRFNQVENNLIEKINPLDEQFVKNIIKSFDSKKLRNSFSQLINNYDGICLSCVKEPGSTFCLASLITFMVLIISNRIDDANFILLNAAIGTCLWALWIILYYEYFYP
jgi:hypothetical protein